MTNVAIIGQAKMLHGITEEVDTFAGWKRRGKKIKKGSKALFKTSIWKPAGKKKTDDEQEDEESAGNMFLVVASFFGASQVEDMREVRK